MPETAPAAETADQPAAEWSGEFDPERAGRLVAALRRDLAEAKSALTAERERAAELEKVVASRDLADARSAAITKHGVPASLAGYITGDNAEEIEASAAKVAADFGSAAQAVPALPELPKPRLTPGRAANDAGDVYDPREVARRIAATA
ncbi:hypothetical protein AB0B94_03435 [Micromonospora sp. NPDC048986]|uniref:hypothetical protein n=1 Tax=Micromonospora sp. NPDC048986 TaxID=3155644 RepID=UPI0033C19965